MKKVILQENRKEEVYLSDLNDFSIIGVENEIGTKFLLSKTKKGYELIGGFNITISNKIQYKTMIDAIVMREEVYLFDTAKELFKWLSDD